MARTNAVREFERAMKPHVQALREIQLELKEEQAKSTYSDRYGVRLLADQVAVIASSVEELSDAVASALEPRSS